MTSSNPSTPVIPMKSNYVTAEPVARYVVEQIVPDTSLERRLRLETLELPQARMISSSDVGAVLALLARTVGARNAIEIGTFTGYTALKIAGALVPGGRLITCDINSDWTGIGRKYWQEAGLDKVIDLRLGPAAATLEAVMAESGPGSIDFVFIDADKRGYEGYFETCLRLVRPGGLIVLDNMLWHGTVADSNIQDETTQALRELNLKISRDPRVNAVLLTVGDGLMVARRAF